MKSQDLFGIFFAIGITVFAVGFAFTGESIPEPSPSIMDDTTIPQNEIPISRGSVLSQGIGVGGLSNPDGESIEFDFVSGDEINLDDSNGFLRAKITYNGYLQKMGMVTLGVYSANTGEAIKKSEVVLDLIGDNIWVTDVMHRFDKQEFIDNPDLLGTYIFKISTENGMLSGKAPFTVLMPSVKPIEEVKMVTSSVPTTVTPQSASDESVNKQIKVTSDGFDLSSLEPLLTEKISKTYLTKILKEYYAKNISKKDFVHLKSFEDLECNVTFELNEKAGMNALEFEKYVMNSIVRLYEDLADEPGKRNIY